MTGRRKNRKKNKKFKADPDEKKLIALHKYACENRDSEKGKMAMSLCNWYVKTHQLTVKQWVLARQILKPSNKLEKIMKKRACKTTYVYVMETESAIKIGLSKNPTARRSDLQVGNSSKVNLIMSIQLESRLHAQLIERHLHKVFARYRLSGEWFSKNSLNSLRTHRLPHGLRVRTHLSRKELFEHGTAR